MGLDSLDMRALARARCVRRESAHQCHTRRLVGFLARQRAALLRCLALLALVLAYQALGRLMAALERLGDGVGLGVRILREDLRDTFPPVRL